MPLILYLKRSSKYFPEQFLLHADLLVSFASGDVYIFDNLVELLIVELYLLSLFYDVVIVVIYFYFLFTLVIK